MSFGAPENHFFGFLPGLAPLSALRFTGAGAAAFPAPLPLPFGEAFGAALAPGFNWVLSRVQIWIWGQETNQVMCACVVKASSFLSFTSSMMARLHLSRQ